MHLEEVLRTKGREVVTITPDSSVRELLDNLADHNIGAVVVSRDGATIDGIVSERDVVRHLRANTQILEAPVETIMTSQVHTASPSDTIHELMLVMTEHRIRHIPVLVDGKLAGLVSIGDVVKTRIGELEFERAQLEHYIAGS